MRYALIGCGRISGNHIKAALENKLQIVAVCDVVKEKAESLKSRFNLAEAAVFDDYKKMISDVSPELVAIATDSGYHAEIAVYCAEHKVDFIVEKPMSMSIAEADSVIKAVSENGVTASVCHQNRFNIAVQELKKAVDEGRFGKLSHGSVCIRWNRGENYYKQDAWRGKWALDGGTLMNQCIHGMDLLRWVFGDEIYEVCGMTANRFHPYIEGEDVGTAVVRFKNGAVATIEGTTNTFSDLEETLSVFGEDGMVRLAGMSANTIDIWKFRDERSADDVRRFYEEKTDNVYGNGHVSLYLDVINAVEDNRKPYIDVYAGKRALELVLAVYKSQKTGQVVKLPLKSFSSAEMTGEFGESE